MFRRGEIKDFPQILEILKLEHSVLEHYLDDGVIIVKEVDGIIAGFISITKHAPNVCDNIPWNFSDGLFIHRVAVRDEYRVKGVATELLYQSEKYAIENNHYSLRMVLPEEMSIFQKILRKCGWGKIKDGEIVTDLGNFGSFEKKLSEVRVEELFDIGVNFENFVGSGLRSERERISKNSSRIVMSENDIARIEKIDKKISCLCVAEMWCPEAQLNLTALKAITDINRNITMKVVTKSRGEVNLRSRFGIPVMKIPFVIVFTDKVIGTFSERPNILKDKVFSDIKVDYLKGKYLSDTISDFIDILEKA